MIAHSFEKNNEYCRDLLKHIKIKNLVPKNEVSLAHQKGLEPLTFWFVAKHSIQLSYWRITFVPKYKNTPVLKNQVLFSKKINFFIFIFLQRKTKKQLTNGFKFVIITFAVARVLESADRHV